jgi:hypothetical protein
MVIGVDFDNTIVCYDELFWQMAREDELIPDDIDHVKEAVRDYLREVGREEEWTRLQGIGYGERIGDAKAFPGVINFLVACREASVPLRIISHKTRLPYSGLGVDLHDAARSWLEIKGFFDPTGVGLEPSAVHFELTKQAKLERIAAEACSYFVDDLPEFLADPQFPAGVRRILFDPANIHVNEYRFERLAAWSDATGLLSTGEGGRR